MTGTNDERIDAVYWALDEAYSRKQIKDVLTALDAHDRAQAWGPEAREAMARDACNAWLNAPGSDWLLVVDAVLRHVRGPMPSGVTIGMSSAAIQAYREGPGDIVERMDRALTAALAAAPKPDRPSAENIGRLVKAAGRALGALQNSSDMISSDINMGYDGKKWAQRPIDDLDAALAPFTDPQQEGEKSAGVASAAPAAMTSLSDALAHIAAVGTGVAMKAQWNALHTILSTLVAEREAQGRRDERVREAARKLGSETYDVALSALAAALGEDGR